MRRLSISLVLAILQSPMADAEAQTFVAYGYGNDSCATFVNSNAGYLPGQGKSLTSYFDQRKYISENSGYTQWIQGFISALNMTSDTSKQHRQIMTDMAGIVAWTQAWCVKHPAESLASGVANFASKEWGMPFEK